jgi:protein phosphatase
MARFEQLHVHVQTDVGVKRDHNEDAIGFVERADLGDEIVVVVADGMGGEAAGEVASGMLVDAFRERLADCDRSDRHDAMAKIVDETNEKIVDMAQNNPEMQGMGSTVVALSIADDGYARFVHVGDSRLYMFHDGRLERLTRDHSRVQLFVDEGILSPDEAEEHPESNVLTQAVGRSEMGVDKNGRREVPWKDATFLVCSDGLTAMVPESVIQLAMAGLPVEDAADALIEECNRLGATDNVSVGVVRDGEPERPLSRAEFHEQVPALIEQYDVMKAERKRKREQRIAEQERAAAKAAESRASEKGADSDAGEAGEADKGSGHLLWLLIALVIVCGLLVAFLIGRSAGQKEQGASSAPSSSAVEPEVAATHRDADTAETAEPDIHEDETRSSNPENDTVRRQAEAAVGSSLDVATDAVGAQGETTENNRAGAQEAESPEPRRAQEPAETPPRSRRIPEPLNSGQSKPDSGDLETQPTGDKPLEQEQPTGLAPPTNRETHELPDGPAESTSSPEPLEPKPKR